LFPQNIRNNKTKARTPKWASRYGLVDTTTLERHAKRSQWASRYNERNPDSTLAQQAYEEGQVAGSNDTLGADRPARREGEGETNLWNPEEESFYTEEQGSGRERASAQEGGTSRWHYPANFEDALPTPEPKAKKSSSGKSKKDRWARTEDAYNAPSNSGERRSRRKSRTATSSTTNIPEQAEDALYSSSQPRKSTSSTNGYTAAADNRDGSRTPPARRPTGTKDEFAHQF
jgi:hypothetical protein